MPFWNGIFLSGKGHLGSTLITHTKDAHDVMLYVREKKAKTELFLQYIPIIFPNVKVILMYIK